MKDRKKIFEAVFFITVTVLALSVLFRGQNWSDLLLLIRKSNPVCLLSAVFLGLLFVCLEGYMIWRLLRLSGNDATLPGCIRYSFIGYFYSGITPSATGGSPRNSTRCARTETMPPTARSFSWWWRCFTSWFWL